MQKLLQIWSEYVILTEELAAKHNVYDLTGLDYTLFDIESSLHPTLCILTNLWKTVLNFPN